MGSKPFYNWDIDFKTGTKAEELVVTVMSTTEVKNDSQWQKTGNLYIETDAWYNSTGEFGPSGISLSKADYYTFVLPPADIVLSFPTSLVKQVMQDSGRTIAMNHGSNPTKGVLIKVSDLITASLSYRPQEALAAV